jgi:hypothetical protein
VRNFDASTTCLTDNEIEKQLAQLAFTIALDTTHYHAFSGQIRNNIRNSLQANKQILHRLRQERLRRIHNGIYKPR